MKDCRGLPLDMRVCDRCPRLAEPTVQDTTKADKVQWISPDIRWEEAKWRCLSRPKGQ